MQFCVLHTPAARAICRSSSVPLLIALLLGIYKPSVQQRLMTVLGWLLSAMILAVFIAF
ncbi:MAG TPA: hypothetical protein PLY87_04885 [Planctomycetaceae bacterium]|nr:hypothetical protein [Planctomycetaceae bacterium]HQZ64386.1 hypothetical protein [Planctomycetaceae bacterium]